MSLYVSSHQITPGFKSFIISILGRAQLSRNTIDALTDEDSMIVFRKAFTHISYDKEFNYEFLEFRGDVVVNLAIVQYIRTRFPKIISVKWLTKLKHNLASKTALADLASLGHFLEHLHYGKDLTDIIKRGRYHENVEYLSLMEDTFEALAGAIVQIVDQKYHHGVGFAVAFTIISTFFDQKEISLSWNSVFDTKSRLKEIYDQLGWNIEQNISTRPDSGQPGKHFSIITGYPKGDKTRKPENKEVVGKGVGPTPQLAQDAAAEKALEILRKRYYINEIIPSPYLDSDVEGIPPKTFDIPDGFKEFISGLLEKSGMDSIAIPDFIGELDLIEFRLGLIDKTYDAYVNHNLYKFIGVAVVDLAIAEYIGIRFPNIVSEKWLTNIKHNIVSQGAFSIFAREAGLDRYILYGKEMEENIERHPDLGRNTEFLNMLEGAFKAFMGVLVTVVDAKRQRGVGYIIAYNLISVFMNRLRISVDYTDVFNHKSRLKELYDKNRWQLDQSITIEYDAEKNLHVATIVGFPRGNRRRDPKNKVILATESGRTKKDAEQKASEKAIDVLDRVYKIREIPPDPNQL